MHVHVILFKKKEWKHIGLLPFLLVRLFIGVSSVGVAAFGYFGLWFSSFGVWGLGSVPLVISKNELTTKRFYTVQMQIN